MKRIVILAFLINMLRTGSTMFERDLRLYTKDKKWVFASCVTLFPFRLISAVRNWKFDSSGM